MAQRLAFLHFLPAFEAVARLGSVRAAAAELNLSPSAISLQLRKLSDLSGMALFEKSGRNLALTRSGANFAESVAICLSQLSQAAMAARDVERAQETASLAVSLPTALGVAWLSGAIVDYAESRNIPNLVINEAISADQVDWDANDVAIVYDNPPFPGKHWRLLSQVRLRTVCSPILFPRLDLQHRDRKLNGITLLHEDDGEEWAKWAVAARVSLQGSGRVRVDSVAQAIASAVQGHGIALVSNVLTMNYLAEGRLIQPFLTSINAAHEYYILCREERAEEPMIQSLIERILDYSRPNRS